MSLFDKVPYRYKVKYWKLLTVISPTLNSKVVYRIRMPKKLNIKDPKTLNEKLMWLKLYRYNASPLTCECSDKVAVRDYVKRHDCEKYLVPSCGVYDKPEDIPWDDLPNKFVVKWNYGSGFNIFCTDKKTFDKQAAIDKLNRWKKSKFWRLYSELQYENIEQKLLVEEWIETADGLPPRDYKIFCSYGEPKLLFVASERIEDHTKFDYYYPDWTWIPVKNNHPNAGDVLPRPAELDEMLEAASKLSKEFPIVRVDFYLEQGRIYFGELTFSHFGCRTPFEPDEYDRIFGDLFPIDKEIAAGKMPTRPKKTRRG